LPNDPRPAPAPLPVIEYNTPPADAVQRQKFVAAMAIVGLLAAVLLFGLVFVRSSAPRVTITPIPALTATASPAQAQSQQRFNQQRLDGLLADQPSPQAIAYEEDPASAATLKAQGSMQEADRRNISQPLWSAFQPPIFTPAPYTQQHGGEQTGLLFAHERTSPGGNRRLVIVEIAVNLSPRNTRGEEADILLERQLRYRICDTKLSGNSPTVLRYGQSLRVKQAEAASVIPIRWIDGSLRANRPAEQNLRFYAGQIDRNDASHFTMAYALGKQSSTIDVYLTDDDFLRVLPQSGTIDAGTWKIDQTPPAKKP
jgi:hypothetical protein